MIMILVNYKLLFYETPYIIVQKDFFFNHLFQAHSYGNEKSCWGGLTSPAAQPYFADPLYDITSCA